MGPARIPFALSNFLGRQRELDDLRALTASERLITITGTGGIGKTRLAFELVRGTELADSVRGVWIAELARLEDGDLVATAIAESVRAPNVRGADPIERARLALGDGRHLLVLDNCEHVITAAGDAARDLLQHCPDLVVLATSREPLRVDGERVYRVQTLGLPNEGSSDVAAVRQAEAVQLFCDRAQRVSPNIEVTAANVAAIASICVRLDGLPLALELAAAWGAVLSFKQIAARLEADFSLLGERTGERPSRHRTIRAALDWSYQLLAPPERSAFSRLSIFVSGFSVESANAVLGRQPRDDNSTLELLAALVERSLIEADTARDEVRFRMLEPVRQFAAGQLHALPEEEREARSLQLGYLAMLAEAAEELILGGPDQPWLQRLDDELGNIRAVLDWALDAGLEDAFRLVAATIWYCYIRRLYSEGIGWAIKAMLTADTHVRARAAHMAGTLSAQMGDADSAADYLAMARRLLTDGNWLKDLTMVVFDQGVLAYHKGDRAVMDERSEEAVQLARSLGDETRIMQTISLVALSADLDRDFARSSGLWREGMLMAQGRKARWTETMYRTNLADSLIEQADWTAAAQSLRECLTASGEFDDSITTTYVIQDIGIWAIHAGHYSAGMRLMASARASFDRWHFRETPDEAARQERWAQAARQNLDELEAEWAWGEGMKLSLKEAVFDALDMLEGGAEIPARTSGRGPGHEGISTVPAGVDPPNVANSFVREGDFWSLTYGDVVVRVKDTKGVRDIVRLLAMPRNGVAAIDLLSDEHRRASGGRAVVKELGLGIEADVGEALDAEARAQYRSRLYDLEEEINEAEAHHDPERASRAREEREFLLGELGAAVGLGGRPRRALDPTERARKAVTGRIRDAIGHIELVHPQLGRHLRRSIRTGSFCVYDPPEPTPWRL